VQSVVAFPSAKPKFTRRLVRRSAPVLRSMSEEGSGVGRFIEGGLARHPLGGLKDSVHPCYLS
jgi:hypothetical protein